MSALALRAARKIIRGLKVSSNYGRTYAVVNRVVEPLKEHGDR